MTDAMEIPGGWVTLGRPGPIVRPVANPAAGADWSAVLSSNELVAVRSIRAILTTSATVANRSPQLQMTDANGDVLYQDGLSAAIAASVAPAICWAQGLDSNGQAGVSLSAPLPLLWLPPGAVLKVSTALIAAGDQWSAVVVTYDRHPYAPAHWPSTAG